MNRRRFLQHAAAGLLSAALSIEAADAPLPKAETILERYIEVTGGRKAYEKHKSESSTMSMEFIGKGIKGTGVRLTDGSNSYESMTLDGVGKIDTGVQNGVVWESNAITGPRVLQGAEKADRLRDATFNSALQWRTLWKSAETTGIETVEGEECYRVVLTPAEGKPETSFYSKKTGLLVKKARVVASQMGEMPVEVFASDYKSFDGVLMPTKVSQRMMGNEILVTQGDVKFNTAIPAEKFEPPADIKKLLAK